MDDAAAEATIRFRLNGAPQTVAVPPTTSVFDMLRGQFGLNGPKLGCSRAVCGSCTIVVDRKPAASCALLAFQLDGAEVTTIEGLAAADGTPHPVQQAFAAKSAFQCGYCTSGMIVLAATLLDHHPDPDRATVVEWMSSNICRCTGYNLIIEAVLDAAQATRGARAKAAP